MWHFRGINVIQDAPVVQFSIDGTAVETADYGAVTVYHPAHTGTRPIQLAIKNPSDLSTTDPGFTNVGDDASVDFKGKTNYTLVAAGTVASPRKLLITGTSTDAVADNNVSYQFINAAVNIGSLEVSITAPEAGISTPQVVDTLALGAASTEKKLTIAAASGAADSVTRVVNITIQVKAGSSTIYQSSALNFQEQTRVLFVIADNVGPPNVSPVKVFVVGGTAAGVAGVALDPDDGTELRFANLSPDAGSLDLIVGTSAADIFASNVAFGTPSAYGPLATGTYNSIATPTGNAGSFLFVNNFTASPAHSYTLYAQGELADLRGLLFVDDRRSVPTEAHFRFLHASPAEGGGALDIYVRQSGAGLDLSATSPPAPTVAALVYRGLSTQLVLKAGTYDVYLAHAGDKSTILGPVPLVLAAGGVETVAVADSPADRSLQLVPVDDARP